MKIDAIRVYAEVLEQGIDIKEYIREAGFTGKIINIYTKKGRGDVNDSDSLIDRLRKVKDIDILLTCISENEELPLFMIEYSTAVPTDDHKMQRSDVYFWSSVFKIPMMKISPSSKGMGQDFGGGSSFSDEYEIAVAYKRGAIFYPISWATQENKEILLTKFGSVSCIYHSDEIKSILQTVVKNFHNAISYEEFYKTSRECYYGKYKEIICDPAYQEKNLCDVIGDSKRFHWFGSKLSVKINRFGHAMDPDRGVLYFVNMLVGAENTITEIQVNRANFSCRGGYNALFDAVAREQELINYVKKIHQKRSSFTDDEALYIFAHALNIERSVSFTKISSGNYIIDDSAMEMFLFTHPSMTSKSIFYLSTELRLTDVNRDIICTIKWNKNPIDKYLKSVITAKHTPISIEPLTFKCAKEDIITFSSVELYKRINCNLLAVSYPGAQGDRCILTGQGRNVLRTYVDIIAYKKKQDMTELFLEESKDTFSKSDSDVKKLIDIKKDKVKYSGLALLAEKTADIKEISGVYLSVGAKATKKIPRFDVDYIFMFDVESRENKTIIGYSVALINTKLANEFLPLATDGAHLRGEIEMDQIYMIQ